MKDDLGWSPCGSVDEQLRTTVQWYLKQRRVVSMTELCKLGLKYGTDKYPSYTPFYDILFNQKRLAVTRVLELGIGTVGCMGHVP